MSTRQSALDNVYRGICRTTEFNLKLQQELLRGWTRYWPGFTGRPANEGEETGGFLRPWSNSLLRAVRAHRDFVDQQFDTAIATLDLAFGTDHQVAAPTVAAEAATAEAAEEPKAPETAEKAPPVAAPMAEPPSPGVAPRESGRPYMSGTRNIAHKVAVVTGAASGIGEAVSRELAHRGAKAVLLVDRSDQVVALANAINEAEGRTVAISQVGDTTDAAFRKRVFNQAVEDHGIVTICVPAAGITRDDLAVRIDKQSGKAQLYPVETFRQVTEVNLIAPIYWAIEMIGRIAEDRRERGLKRWEPEERIQGAVVFLGSVSSQGNKGQISYGVAKAGLEGAAATLMKEAIFHGVRCGVIHPGFTDTPMAKALGQEFLEKNVLPYTQLRRLIRPEEIADAICFMISNAAVSGELWADAGWHPPA